MEILLIKSLGVCQVKPDQGVLEEGTNKPDVGLVITHISNNGG